MVNVTLRSTVAATAALVLVRSIGLTAVILLPGVIASPAAASVVALLTHCTAIGGATVRTCIERGRFNIMKAQSSNLTWLTLSRSLARHGLLSGEISLLHLATIHGSCSRGSELLTSKLLLASLLPSKISALEGRLCIGIASRRLRGLLLLAVGILWSLVIEPRLRCGLVETLTRGGKIVLTLTKVLVKTSLLRALVISAGALLWKSALLPVVALLWRLVVIALWTAAKASLVALVTSAASLLVVATSAHHAPASVATVTRSLRAEVATALEVASAAGVVVLTATAAEVARSSTSTSTAVATATSTHATAVVALETSALVTVVEVIAEAAAT